MTRAVAIALGAVLLGCTTTDVLGTRAQSDSDTDSPVDLPNPLDERQQIPISEVNARLNAAFLQLFYGDPETEAVYRDQGDGTGFVEDVANQDVRTDSMAYGMLVTVQLDYRNEFDKLWSWTKEHMQSPSGASAGLLRWRCDLSGENCEPTAATDASSIIATSLLMAESRWGNAGAHDYEADGLALLEVMATIEQRNGGVVDGVVNCFDVDAALPRYDSARNVKETPVDYLMPAFYEIWARRDPARAGLWRRMADNARSLLSRVSDPVTGLLPEAVTYDGVPVPGRDAYRVTTSRTYLNLALDQIWDGPYDWIVEQNERRLDFFLGVGVDAYVAEYTLDGTPLVNFNGTAHRALVALAAGTSENPAHDVFLEALLDEPIPTGDLRYYSGMLYMLSLLVLSGQMTPP